MNNRYSGSLLVIMLTLIGVGFISLFLQSLWGLVLLILGASMLLGLVNLPASPRTVGIITFWSKKVPVVVEGYTLTLSWPIDIINVIPIDAQRKKHRVEVKDVRVKGGVWLVGNEITMELGPDLEDDLQLSGGEKLILWDDNKRFEGVSAQASTMVLERLRARCAVASSYLEVVSDSERMNTDLESDLRNGAGGTGSLRQLGATLFNLQSDLVPSEDVKKADERKALEELESAPEIKDTNTFRQQAEAIIEGARAERAKLKAEDVHEDDLPPLPTFGQALDRAKELRLIAQGKLQKIEGGSLVNFNQVGDNRRN